ncbi:MAG: nitroreductase family protein, partial [Treponema sp.]|nr:nitroreductase family protein [Treponema sp.]
LVCFDRNNAWVRPFDGEHSGWVDASIVTTHLMLQAADIGLGSTWVMYFDAEKVRAAFNLPQNIVPVALLPLGCPAEGAVPADRHNDRLSRDKLVFFDNYSAACGG